MPSVKKILGDDRSKRGDSVIGYVEGNFIRFYEHSAYLLAQRHGLKPTKRVYKNVGVEVVSVGFPKTSHDKYLPGGIYEPADDTWTAVVAVQPPVSYEEWKASVPLTVPDPKEEPVATVDKLAQVSGLPVFKACYDLLLYVMQWSANVGRDLRYTVGEDLKRRLVEVELSIYRANKCAARDRLDHVVKAQEVLEESLIYLRLLYDMRQIALAQYAHTAELASEVEKQLGNWRRFIERDAAGRNGEKNQEDPSASADTP